MVAGEPHVRLHRRRVRAPLLTVSGIEPGRFYATVGKRAFDLSVAGLGLILLLPLLALLAVLVRLRLGTPIIFRQRRPGLNGEPFVLLKFRTMDDSRDEHGQQKPDDERLGAFGAFLRRTSLDELPELWNVMRGEMSLVGPRPLLMEYLSLYSPEQARRHDVRPGVTGLAQVNGRNAISWEERFALDVQYVERISLVLDVRILVRTVLEVVSHRGISAPGHVSMPKFTGRAS